MPTPFVENGFFFPMYNFSFFVKNQVIISVWINIWVLHSIPLVNISVLMPIPSCFHYCSPILELDIRDGHSSESSFIVWNCFGYLEFYIFSYKVFSRSMKMYVGILMEIVLNL